MRIYLAGSAAARYRVAIYAADLENLGHRVTSRWHRRSDPHTDSVLYTSQPNRVAELAREDFRGMLEAHVLLAFTETHINPLRSGGGGVELGIALALDKPVVVYGDLSLRWHYLGGAGFDVHTAANWSACLDRLAEIEKQYDRRRTLRADSRSRQANRRKPHRPLAPDGRSGDRPRELEASLAALGPGDGGPPAPAEEPRALAVEARRDDGLPDGSGGGGAEAAGGMVKQAADSGLRATGNQIHSTGAGSPKPVACSRKSLWCRFGLHQWTKVTQIRGTMYLRCQVCGRDRYQL